MSQSGSQMALRRWELENGIDQTDEDINGEVNGATGGGRARDGAAAAAGSAGASSSSDALFVYSQEEQSAVQRQRAWTSDPEYFTHVKVSALALLKMAIHCRGGGDIEVMGMLQGKTVGKCFVVLDAFALPVEGTETRVNAQVEAYEYMVEFSQESKEVGRLENVVGWYHSHPGYGCWMSGIDCGTQRLNQQYQEPFLAIVIDPHRTAAAGKVEIGAFRTFPEGYDRPAASGGSTRGNQTGDSYQPIPLAKMEDFGAYASQYYSLEVSYFKSSLDSHLMDMLWNKYWVDTLSNTPLLSRNYKDFVSGQIRDLAEKIEQTEGKLSHSGRGLGMGFFLPGDASSKGGGENGKGEETPLSKVARESMLLAAESIKSQAGQVTKDLLFNFRKMHVHHSDSMDDTCHPMES